MATPKTSNLKRGLVAFLQTVVWIIGIGVLLFLLQEPRLEGVNAHATFVQTYCNPFVIFAYLASVPFFMALYQAIKLLRYAGNDNVFSLEAVKAVRLIKGCALAIIGFVAVSVIFMIHADRDDRPAGLFMRLVVASPSMVVAATAAVVERILQNALDIKSENDLIV